MRSMRSHTTLMRNSGAMLAASVVTRMVGYASTIAIARMLGGEQFGRLALASVLVGYFGILVEFGTGNWLVREVARDRKQAQPAARATTRLRLRLFAISLPLIALLALSMHKTSDVKLAVVIVALILLPKSLTGVYVALMQGCQRVDLTAALSVVEVTSSLSLCILALLIQPSIVTLAAASLVAAFVELFTARVLCSRAGCNVRLAGAPGRLAGTVAGGAPFFVTAILGAAYFKADILLLSFLLDDRAVGCYSAASRLIESARFIPWAITFPLYPVLSKAFSEGRDGAQELQARAAGILLAAGLPIAVLGSIFSRDIIMLVFGPEYIAAAASLRWLACAVPLMYVNILFCFSAYAQDRQRQVIRLMSVMFVFNMSFNIWAIPIYGAAGAAASTVFTEVLALVYYGWTLMRRSVALGRFSGTAAKAVVACGAAVCIVPVSAALGPFLAATVVFALYCALLVGLGAVNLTEVRALSAMAGAIGGGGVEQHE